MLMLKQITCEVGIKNKGPAWWGGGGEERKWDRNTGIWENRVTMRIITLIPSLSRASTMWGLPRALSGKEPACHAGDTRDAASIPGLGRSPGEGNDPPLHCSRLENSMNRGAWWAAVHEATESLTWLSNWAQPYYGKYLTYISLLNPCKTPVVLPLFYKEEVELQNIKDWPSSPDVI